jgi:hypothetical protein
MKDDTLQNENKNRKLGYYISFGIHIAIFLLFFIPFVKMITFPPEESGIMIVFGEPEAGNPENEYQPEIATTSPSAEPVKKSAPNEIMAKTKDEISEIKTTEVKKTKPENKVDQNKIEAEKAEREKQEKLLKEKEAAEKKQKISDLFGKGSKGNPGNEGKKDGSPDGKVLDGITKGSGRVGGGLASRGLLFEPKFQDNSQRSGRVVLTICVDINGKVISSKFTQKGSTTNDPYLIKLTENTASKYKFSASTIDSQCGTITVEYKVQ